MPVSPPVTNLPSICSPRPEVGDTLLVSTTSHLSVDSRSLHLYRVANESFPPKEILKPIVLRNRSSSTWFYVIGSPTSTLLLVQYKSNWSVRHRSFKAFDRNRGWVKISFKIITLVHILWTPKIHVSCELCQIRSDKLDARWRRPQNTYFP